MSDLPTTELEGQTHELIWDGLSCPLISDVSSPEYIMNPTIRPVWRPIWFSGPAFTVLMPGGDNLPLHRALAAAPPGCVLVAAAESDVPCGVWGELMSLAARRRGIRGLVTNAWVRDYDNLQELGFPVFARGLRIQRAQKVAPGTLNQPVVCGGVTVSPGDWVIGDSDGIVVIPQEQIIDIHTRAKAQQTQEASIRQALEQGQLTLDILDLRSKAESYEK